MEVKVWETLAELELVIPRTEFVWAVHVVGHVVGCMRNFGPVREWWAFPYESFMGHLKRYGK